jgi:tripartite-type tricarboxylate transporter receptor subunit TctC
MLLTRRGVMTYGAFGLVLASTFALPANAQNAWPNKPIKIIVSYAAGGGADTLIRVIAPKLGEALGQQIVIENRSGAGGLVGGEVAAKSAPDGYTFLMDAASHGINPSLVPKMPFDTLKDLAPVSLVATVPNVLAVTPNFPAQSIKELIAMVKASPGKYSFGSAGNGSVQHMSGELLKAQAGLFMVHIPYRGGAPAMADLMAGQIPMYFGSMASATSNLKSGRMRPIAVTGSKRSAAFPNVPTMMESGYPQFEAYEWNALFAPASTPTAITERMAREVNKIIQLPEIKDRFAGLSAEPIGSTPAVLEQFRRKEIAQWADVIKRANIRLE